jgi:hypothetical protein
MGDIESQLNELRNEIDISSTSFFGWMAINNLALEDRAIFDALNRHATSFNLFRHGLQVTFFTTLGRLFDTDKRSFTLSRFLLHCKESVDQFSGEALRNRKLRSHTGTEPEWLPAYVAAAYRAEEKDFVFLEKSIEPWQVIYEAKYKPIRNKLVAHKDFAALMTKEELYGETNIGEVRGLLLHLFRVERVVNELLMNGRLTALADHSNVDRERGVEAEVMRLLRTLQ